MKKEKSILLKNSYFCDRYYNMAKDLKPHIGIFGRRNNGKSSIINLMTGQNIAIVSDQAGTTTDPVKKSIEIFGIGPAILIDTAGIDDLGELGQKRIEKSYQALNEIDCAILVLADNQFGKPETDLIAKFDKYGVPYLVVHNKADRCPINVDLKHEIESHYRVNVIDFSTTNEDKKDELIEMLKKTIPETSYQKVSLLGGLVKPNEVVVLVCPIDAEAPDGRMILPQVMAIRDVLDNNCICVVVKETNLKQYFEQMPRPALVVTDSQAFKFVSEIVPVDIPLTSFSIVMARLRGDFDNYLKGTPALSKLKDGDKILMLESCTHQVSCEDIGRVKLPNLIRKFAGKELEFTYISGLAPIENINQYALVIQCGGCMATRKQLINRTNLAVHADIPISNYGMSIAYVTGIFNRVTAMFRQ
jgi:hydrogenase maturation GTPase HydF